MKIYEVILEGGNDVFKTLIPAKSTKDVKKQVQGNGEIVKIKDVTYKYPISIDFIRNELRGKLGYEELTIVLRILQNIPEIFID
mgnify:CR=1 FL=1